MRYFIRNLRMLGLGVVTSLSLMACGSGGDGNAVLSSPALTGKAVDSNTGLGIAGVTVRVGERSTTTGADGSFTLLGVAAGSRVPVQFESSSYAEGTRITDVVDGETTDVQALLIPVAFSASVSVAAGGTVTVPNSTAQVVLPANSVQRADGSVPTGDFTVRLTPINPAMDSTLMPGDFMASTSGGNIPIESYGAITVSLTDSAGVPLNLKSGQTATIRIPMASRNSEVPASIPLYYFNTSTGLWQEEGSATLFGADATAYYEGTVSHFSTWNADVPYNTIYVQGCVKNAAGGMVNKAVIKSDGIDYTGTSKVYTNVSGNFSLPIRKNSIAAITGVFSGYRTNTISTQISAGNIVLSDCLTLNQAGGGVSIKLTWGARPADLDAYIITPNGEKINFGNKGSLIALPFAKLEVDDRSSYGPEIISIGKLMVGTYKYSVNNYSGFSIWPIQLSGARVELTIPGSGAQLMTLPAVEQVSGLDFWSVFEFDVSATCAVTVRPVQTYAATGPIVPAATAPQYCTP